MDCARGVHCRTVCGTGASFRRSVIPVHDREGGFRHDVLSVLLYGGRSRRLLRIPSGRHLRRWAGQDGSDAKAPVDGGDIRDYSYMAFLCRTIAPERAVEATTLKQLRYAGPKRRCELKQQLLESAQPRLSPGQGPSKVSQGETQTQVMDQGTEGHCVRKQFLGLGQKNQNCLTVAVGGGRSDPAR